MRQGIRASIPCTNSTSNGDATDQLPSISKVTLVIPNFLRSPLATYPLFLVASMLHRLPSTRGHKPVPRDVPPRRQRSHYIENVNAVRAPSERPEVCLIALCSRCGILSQCEILETRQVPQGAEGPRPSPMRPPPLGRHWCLRKRFTRARAV